MYVCAPGQRPANASRPARDLVLLGKLRGSPWLASQLARAIHVRRPADSADEALMIGLRTLAYCCRYLQLMDMPCLRG